MFPKDNVENKKAKESDSKNARSAKETIFEFSTLSEQKRAPHFHHNDHMKTTKPRN